MERGDGGGGPPLKDMGKEEGGGGGEGEEGLTRNDRGKGKGVGVEVDTVPLNVMGAATAALAPKAAAEPKLDSLPDSLNGPGATAVAGGPVLGRPF